jgi:hypothetical protein
VQLANGDIVVAWMSEGQDGWGYGTYARILSSNGTPKTGEFLVNTTTYGNQEGYEEGAGPRLAALSDGGFVVTWHGDQGDGWGRGVYAQRFDAQGDKVGGEQQVNINVYGGPHGDQSFPAVVGTPSGFTVVFDSNDAPGDGGTYGISSRSFALEPVIAPVGGEDQVNTTTAGRQTYSDVSSASPLDGSYVVVWRSESSIGGGDIGVSGGDGSELGIFAQR